MAAKKIGAIITLDGEKEYRSAVTNCNKTLSMLKSEMGLVKAQCEGQENSLESLQKKHQVLSKVLDEQKNKEEAVRKGLEHAQQSYDTMGTKLQALRRDLETAKQKLSDMGDAADTSTEDLQAQEKQVQELTAALGKSEENYQRAGNKIKDWESKLNTAEAQVIKATSAVNKNAAYMKEAEQSTDKCATSIDEFGKEVKKAEEVTVDFGTVVKANLGNMVVNTVKSTVSGTASAILDLEGAQRQLQASTGATSAEMLQYKSVMDNLHTNNYGEDINDVASSMALVKQYTGELDASKLEDMTENGIAMRDVFDMDLSETIRGVNSLVTNMGLSADEAFDLMSKGAQNGLNKSGELADNIAEYGQLWGQAGFSAQEMFAILDNGLDSGAYNLDKVNDFVKEFTISLSDGRIEENLDSFSIGTKNMFYQWKSGKATSRDVFYSVINDLSNATNQQEALTLASNTWSALGEDNAMQVITSLNEVNHTYDNVKGTMESIKDIKYDTLQSRYQQLGKTFQVEVGEPIAERALPLMEKGLDLVIENLDTLIPLATGAATGFLAFKGASAAVGLLEMATGGATKAQEGFNLACKANPIILIASAVLAAGTALVTYANNAGEASAEVEILTEMNKRVVSSANEVSESVEDTIMSYAESTAQMQAQGEYAGILAGKIKGLAGQSSLSNEKMSVMQEYIAQLNGLVPDLNLAYDEQAGKLSMTTEEMYKNIEASQKQIAQQAAQEYAIQLIKQKTELEIESIKLQNSGADISERRNTLLEEENDLMLKDVTGIGALISGKQDVREEYKLLTDAQEENTDAVAANDQAKQELAAEEAAVKQYLEEAGLSWDEVTGQVNENTTATDTNTQAQGKNNTTLMESASQIAETYTSLKESVTGALESQMNMFEEFSAGTEISTYDLLHNMQSQIDGVSNWADNMSTLSKRGINEGLLQHLAEMGPEGANYVAAFARMSDDELQKASSMWEESLDIKDGVQENISGMLDGVTTAISGGKDKVAAAMKEVGAGTIAGLTEKLQSGQVEVKAAGDDVGQAAVDGAKTGAGTHSPSWKTAEIGRNMNEGLVNGLNQSKGSVSSTIQQIMNEIIRSASSGLRSSNFTSSGRNVTAGMVQGINAGRSNVTSAMQTLAAQTQTAASTGMNPLRYAVYGMQVPSGLVSGMNRGRSTVATAAKNLGITAYNNVRVPSLYSDGLNVAYGLANGISAGRSAVVSAVANMCASAVNQARSSLRIHSPSRVFAEIGEYTAEGFGVGYEDKMADVNGMIKKTMDYSGLKPGAGAGTAAGAYTGAEKIVIEMPIYNNGIYDRTEIAEIAMEGLSRAQGRKLAVKGGIQNVRY